MKSLQITTCGLFDVLAQEIWLKNYSKKTIKIYKKGNHIPREGLNKSLSKLKKKQESKKEYLYIHSDMFLRSIFWSKEQVFGLFKNY
jgi:hypothetical protein